MGSGKQGKDRGAVRLVGLAWSWSSASTPLKPAPSCMSCNLQGGRWVAGELWPTDPASRSRQGLLPAAWPHGTASSPAYCVSGLRGPGRCAGADEDASATDGSAPCRASSSCSSMGGLEGRPASRAVNLRGWRGASSLCRRAQSTRSMRPHAAQHMCPAHDKIGPWTLCTHAWVQRRAGTKRARP